MDTTIDVRPAAGRGHTKLSWLDSRHSFSFGEHYDPDNTGHGFLIVSNDDRVRPNRGFGTHFHQDMEIITWVLTGGLHHEDSEGNHGDLYPGLAQRMSAGAGIEHSEVNPSHTDYVHFIQMWITPDRAGVAPSYEQVDVNAKLSQGGLQLIVTAASHPGAIRLNQRNASLWVARLRDGERVDVPRTPLAHVFVASGTARLDTHDLGEGDAVRLNGSAETSMVGGSEGAEVLVWAMA